MKNKLRGHVWYQFAISFSNGSVRYDGLDGFVLVVFLYIKFKVSSLVVLCSWELDSVVERYKLLGIKSLYKN